MYEWTHWDTVGSTAPFITGWCVICIERREKQFMAWGLLAEAGFLCKSHPCIEMNMPICYIKVNAFVRNLSSNFPLDPSTVSEERNVKTIVAHSAFTWRYGSHFKPLGCRFRLNQGRVKGSLCSFSCLTSEQTSLRMWTRLSGRRRKGKASEVGIGHSGYLVEAWKEDKWAVCVALGGVWGVSWRRIGAGCYRGAMSIY